MKTWKIGIVGAGLIADFHARATADIENARLVGCCGLRKKRAQALAGKYACRVFKDYHEMVNSDDIDVITIATPSGSHAEPAIVAAQAGKHVLCEKPLEVTLDRIDTMIEAHKQAGTRLGGIFPYRYNDAMVPLKKAIDSGRFGRITYIGAHVPWWREDAYYQDSWHGTWTLDGGGALMNQSIHMIDTLCYLAEPIQSVQAYTAT